MKIADLRERSDADLQQLQQELARELWKARFNNYTNQLDDTAKIARTRKTIAQIHTLLTERARGIVRVVTPKDETVIAAERAAKAGKAEKAKAKAAPPVEDEAEAPEAETAEAQSDEAVEAKPKKKAPAKKKAEAADDKGDKPKKKAPAKKKKAEE